MMVSEIFSTGGGCHSGDYGGGYGGYKSYYSSGGYERHYDSGDYYRSSYYRGDNHDGGLLGIRIHIGGD